MWTLRHTSWMRVNRGVWLQASILRSEQSGRRRVSCARAACNSGPKNTNPKKPPGIEKALSNANRQCHNPPPTLPASPFTLNFWTSRPIWRRALLNTLRCLVGCTIGDFSAMWFLQAYYPDLGVGYIMGASSKPKFFSPPHDRPRCSILTDF